ncbi:MAG: diguanylate cyclase [Helicobacteraceae bacterium]|nr:diguanylate cyclase [Helicobacteraceae bacterium]
MGVNEIVKKTIQRLKNEHKLMTPEFYTKAFCIEAKKAGMLSDDCTQLEKSMKTLDIKYLNELKQYNIKTINDLTRYLVAKLNRMEPNRCSNLLEQHIVLTKAILDSLKLLHNKEASAMSIKTINTINDNTISEQYPYLTQLWQNFTKNYDDTFLETLKDHGNITKIDLKKSVSTLKFGEVTTKENDPFKEYGAILKIITSALVPSIASSVNTDISKLTVKLRTNPKQIKESAVHKEIKQAISLRIALDRQTVKRMILSVDSVLDKLSTKLIELIENSDRSNSDIKKVKIELEDLKEDKVSDFKETHKRLLNIATTLEEETGILSKDLKDHQTSVNAMSEKIELLEEQLREAEQNSREDFLTKLFNKRALDEYMNKSEEEYKRNQINYTLVMFDIDHFKAVNDTYGHDAGDAILTAFSQLLKKDNRVVDVVGRYGGEEFLAILSSTDLKGALKFSNTIREHVQKTKFMFKKQRIDITVSGGAAQRIDFNTLENTLKGADLKLYEAKHGGRNKICS